MKFFLNWKQNGSFSDILEFKNRIITKGSQVVLFPSFPFLSFAIHDKFEIGAQNVSTFKDGAFTGEVGSKSLAEVGVKYCLVGHSERRMLFNETEKELSSKIKELKKVGIIPILCVGESLHERKSNLFFEKLKRQTEIYEEGVLLAYEPIWAIGTGIIPSEKEIAEIADFFSTEYKSNIIYGGSVSEKNAKDITKIRGIEGLLIGGASLDVFKVNKIINDSSRN